MNELDLLAAAMGIADPAERAALLDRECAGRPGLRQRLDPLLAAPSHPRTILDAVPLLAPLRQHPDFQQLLAELE
jgi:hypothetical protein